MKLNPKLLLVAGYFPPVRISTGSIRPWNIARWLRQLAWDVTVVTPQISIWDPKHLDNVENVQDDIARVGLNMVYTGHQLKCLAPSRYRVPDNRSYRLFAGLLRITTRHLGIQNWVGWLPSAVHACRHLSARDVDVILATGAPFWGFEIAYRVSRRLHRPYVMDYRDLWTDDPWGPPSPKWVINQEKRLVHKSAAVTTVSPISGEVLAHKYNIAEKVHTITNGFDDSELQPIQATPFDHFALVFAGMLIPPKRTLSPLFKVLSAMKREVNGRPPWKFHYFGPNAEEATKEIGEWGLTQESEVHPNLPRLTVLPYLKGASLNVVISANSELPTKEDKGVIPGKIYELIGMGAPILSIVPKGSAVETVLNDVGVECFSPREVKRIQNCIERHMNGGFVRIVNRNRYSWEELSQKFDKLLKGCL